MLQRKLRNRSLRTFLYAQATKSPNLPGRESLPPERARPNFHRRRTPGHPSRRDVCAPATLGEKEISLSAQH